MERNRLRRSKSAATFEGNAANIKCKSVSKQSSDSYLCSDGYTDRNEFGLNSFNGAGGKPIKKLLAEEMTKEYEPKRRSPSIIARLMGVEGFPSPQHGHKQQRKASDKRHQYNASIGIHHTSQSVEDLSSRRSSVEQLEFKDVYEDLEASNISSRRYSSAWVSDSRLKKSALEEVHQKSKHILSSKRVPVSKDSENSFDLPDSVFIEQFHDISPSNSLHGHGAALGPSNSVKYEDSAKVWEPERGNERRFDVSSRRKREDGLLLLLHSRHKSCKSCHPPENQFNAKSEKDVLPTQIVLLKPNLGKTSKSDALVPSPGSPHTHSSSFKKHLECRRAKADEAEKRTKRNFSGGLSFSNARCGKDRELARTVTRHMRENLGPFGHDLTFTAHSGVNSGVRGYAGDESSSDVYESDSSSGVEGMNVPSRNSFDGPNCFRSSPSGLESSNCTEAKKRLSERWKMSQRCQDSQPIGKGSTLGEMLAAPDRTAKHKHLDAAAKKVCSTEASFGSSYGNHRDGPPGISSKDGWKDGSIRNSSRSRSLPHYSSGSRIYKMNERKEPATDDLIPSEIRIGGRSKSRKGNLAQNEDNALKVIKTSGRKPYSNCHKINDTSLDPSLDEVESDISHNKQGEEEKLFLQSGGPAITDICLGSDVNGEDATLSSGSIANVYCKQSGNILQDHNSCADDQDAAPKESLICQSDEGSTSLLCIEPEPEPEPKPEPEPEPEPECSENSKEADHHSPVSVLGVSFSEDLSSTSDCFEIVNAELHELRMQLQLLKMESGNYSEEAPGHLSNDEDFTQQAEIVYHEKRVLSGDSWKSTYIDDVLMNSGLETIDHDAFLAAWHSPDCPLDPWIFDIVEKKYWDDATVTKLERKHLFDCMNSAILEAFQEFSDPCPWVRPVLGGFVLKWRRQYVRDALHKFLVQVEERCSRERKERELDREMNWSRVEDCIDDIGKEIEEMLVDDLVDEVILAL